MYPKGFEEKIKNKPGKIVGEDQARRVGLQKPKNRRDLLKEDNVLPIPASRNQKKNLFREDLRQDIKDIMDEVAMPGNSSFSLFSAKNKKTTVSRQQPDVAATNHSLDDRREEATGFKP